MTKRLEIYRCSLCGNIIEVLHPAGGKLVCCNQPMKLMDEKTADSAVEKHVPVIEKIDTGYKVTVGSTLHPMETEHYIEWIELLTNGKSLIQFLKPGSDPVAYFHTDSEKISVREHCNKHGLWSSSK